MCVRRSLVGLTFCTCYLASYLTNKVADAHWWTFASCVLETGLGRDQQQFKISCSCVASCFSAVCGYNLCWVQSIVQTGHSCVSHFA
ncbi:TMEM241 isoform 13 [Pan troglodytes]|uniref:Transmembrane protein 241 n=2 Tax=Homininae TaxID=207598 RepID=E9PLG4_HUMAN|nr:transmembrane protein 241 [Homo sapiens]KAI4045760.1 transmembrane protein 241 [Homo sapiens]PNI61431.1 TMEM241 isoform 13 [Pan troglodytes]